MDRWAGVLGNNVSEAVAGHGCCAEECERRRPGQAVVGRCRHIVWATVCKVGGGRKRVDAGIRETCSSSCPRRRQ